MPAFNQEVLNQVRVANRQRVSYEVASGLTDWDMSYLDDDITQTQVRQLEASVLQHKCPQETVYARGRVAVELPETWWQHWKMDHTGSRWWGWVARRWPVRTRIITMAAAQVAATIDKSVLFPQATRRYPNELGRPVVWLALDETWLVHEYDEYDRARLNQEYREFLRDSPARYGYMSFEEWMASR
jgi:hypothetical protein